MLFKQPFSSFFLKPAKRNMLTVFSLVKLKVHCACQGSSIPIILFIKIYKQDNEVPLLFNAFILCVFFSINLIVSARL